MTDRLAAEVIASGGLTVTEAPRWHDGCLWFSDFFSRRVLRLAPTARGWQLDHITSVPARPSGLGFTAEGRLRVVSMDDCRLLELDAVGALNVVASFGDLVTGPANDMAICADGTAFIGNFGVVPTAPQISLPTAIVAVDAAGSVSVATDDVVFPNGIVVDEANSTVLLAETYRCRITEFDRRGSRLTAPRPWAVFADDPRADSSDGYDIPTVTRRLPMIPDGIALDRRGRLWVADAKGHGATLFERGGTAVAFVDTGELSAFAVALDDAGEALYLCCAPAVETVDHASVRRGAVLRADLRSRPWL